MYKLSSYPYLPPTATHCSVAVPLAAHGTSGSKRVKTGNKGKKKNLRVGEQVEEDGKDWGIAKKKVPRKDDNKAAASTAVHVFANDLNPLSYASLNENRRLNRIKSSADINGNGIKNSAKNTNTGNFLDTFNMCGRDFIRALYGRNHGSNGDIDHCIMNLPQTAVELLDAFKGVGDIYQSALDSQGNQSNQIGVKEMNYPRLHVYAP